MAQTSWNSKSFSSGGMRDLAVHNTRDFDPLPPGCATAKEARAEDKALELPRGHYSPAYILAPEHQDSRGNESIVTDLTPERVLEEYVTTTKFGQKHNRLHHKARPLREAVVVCQESTERADLERLRAALEEQLNIRVMYIHLHRDEGYIVKKTGKPKYNYHAHVGFTNLIEGKLTHFDRKQSVQAQNVCAEALGMERGKPKEETGKVHLAPGDYRRKAQEQEAAVVRATETVQDAADRCSVKERDASYAVQKSLEKQIDEHIAENEDLKLVELNRQLREQLKQSGIAKQADYQALKKAKEDRYKEHEEKKAAMNQVVTDVKERLAKQGARVVPQEVKPEMTTISATQSTASAKTAVAPEDQRKEQVEKRSQLDERERKIIEKEKALGFSMENLNPLEEKTETAKTIDQIPAQEEPVTEYHVLKKQQVEREEQLNQRQSEIEIQENNQVSRKIDLDELNRELREKLKASGIATQQNYQDMAALKKSDHLDPDARWNKMVELADGILKAGAPEPESTPAPAPVPQKQAAARQTLADLDEKVKNWSRQAGRHDRSPEEVRHMFQVMGMYPRDNEVDELKRIAAGEPEPTPKPDLVPAPMPIPSLVEEFNRWQEQKREREKREDEEAEQERMKQVRKDAVVKRDKEWNEHLQKQHDEAAPEREREKQAAEEAGREEQLNQRQSEIEIQENNQVSRKNDLDKQEQDLIPRAANLDERDTLITGKEQAWKRSDAELITREQTWKSSNAALAGRERAVEEKAKGVEKREKILGGWSDQLQAWERKIHKARDVLHELFYKAISYLPKLLKIEYQQKFQTGKPPAEPMQQSTGRKKQQDKEIDD